MNACKTRPGAGGISVIQVSSAADEAETIVRRAWPPALLNDVKARRVGQLFPVAFATWKKVKLELDVGKRMDALPVTALHLMLVALCGLGLAVDMFEMVLGSVLSAVFSAPPHELAPKPLALLLSSVYLGAIVGAPSLGWLADRYGRRPLLVIVLLVVTVSSTGAAFSGGATSLTCWRAVSGLGLGAYPPIMLAYLADQLPPARRGTLTFVASGLAMLGPPLGVFLVRGLLGAQPGGLEAWRWAFLCGSALAGASTVAFMFLPESPRWLARKQDIERAEHAFRRFERSRVVWRAGAERRRVLPASPFFSGASASRRWWAVGSLFLLSPWCTVAFPLLTGAVLAQKGFKLPDTLLFVGLGTLGNLVGSAVAAPLIDGIDRRAGIACFLVTMIATTTVFMFGSSPSLLATASVLFSMLAALHTPALSLYGTELFATVGRARASAVTWALNRVGAASAPLVLLPLLRANGPNAMLAVMAVTWFLSLVVLALAPEGRQRLALD